jgi:hypothetical protein
MQRASVEEGILPAWLGKETEHSPTKKMKYTLYDWFNICGSRFEIKSFRDRFIPVPVRTLQIFLTTWIFGERADASPSDSQCVLICGKGSRHCIFEGSGLVNRCQSAKSEGLKRE